MIRARSSSEAPALAAIASAFQRPINRPGAFFSFAIALSPPQGCWARPRIICLLARRKGPPGRKTERDPMKLGLLADIHEQTKPLRKAIAVLQQHGADRFVVLGDVFEMGKRME